MSEKSVNRAKGTLRAMAGAKSIALAQGEGAAMKTLSITAYTGGPIQQFWWSDPVVIDLATAQVSDPPAPLMFNHDDEQVIGHVTAWEKTETGLTAKAVLSGANERTVEVATSLANGLPWQASIGGAAAGSEEYVKAGVSVRVNGRDIVGPVVILRGARINELSVCALGADSETETMLAAKRAASHITEGGLMEGTNANGTAKIEAAKSDAPAPAKPVEASKPADPVADVRSKVASEYARIAAVETACAGNREIAAKAIAEGWDADRAELEVLRASRAQTGPAIHASGEASLKRLAKTLAAGMLLASGISGDSLIKAHKIKEDVVDEADRDFRSLRLSSLCRHLLAAAGKHIPPGASNETLVKMALAASKSLAASGFSTVGLTSVLSNTANKVLLQSYLAVDDVAGRLCSVGSNPDFKTTTRHRITGSGKLEKVSPTGEIRHVTLTEETFNSTVDTQAAMLTITRKDIINDDTGVFTRNAQYMGRMAMIAKQRAFFELLLSNPSSYFSSGHGNYLEGSGEAFGVTGLKNLVQKFYDQTDSNGDPVSIMPAILLVPTALRFSADQLINSPMLNGTTTANSFLPTANPHAGKYRVESSPWLNAQNLTGSSSLAYYLLANPAELSGFEISYLDGRQNPVVEEADADFDVLGMQWRLVFDFGVDAQDYRAICKSKGEA